MMEKEKDGGNSSNEEEMDVMFKVKLYDPQPSEVKISSKNVAFVKICMS